jgi:hypothetical protein
MAKEYKKVQLKNNWNNNAKYQGISAVFETPTGYGFELQFHTQASLDAKQSTHRLCEEARKLPDDPPTKKKLFNEQVEAFKKVPIPPHVEGLH